MNQIALDQDSPENFDDLTEPVDVLDKDDDVEVEIVNDVPEEDQNRPARVETSEEEESEGDEAHLSKRVQKRIGKLRYEWNEERRQKEQALRENSEAVSNSTNQIKDIINIHTT